MRVLRNNPEVQGGFIEVVNITPDQQERYMQKYQSNYFICLCDEKPAGYIGEIDGDIRIATDPAFQRCGVGLFMVKEFSQRHPGCFAKVKIDNEASLKLFLKAGFKKRYYILEP
jgi:hypothetical protein